MNLDSDIKIAGDKPSEEIRKRRTENTNSENIDKALAEKAKEWGRKVAVKFIEDARESEADEAAYYEMLVQRRMLLSFTATVGFDSIAGETIGGIAQKSFLDTIKDTDAEIFKTSADTGAFSFYYLAFRRGNEIDRRMGQTFAMLCSHDGDPIYQELGEALYCWFYSVVEKAAQECGIN